MVDYLRSSSKIVREIKQMVPTYAAAHEAWALSASKEYIEKLWHRKRGIQREERRKEESVLPPFTDLIFRGILAGADQQLGLRGENSALKAYQDSRDEYTRLNLPIVKQLIDYMDYDNLLTYLHFFTVNTIEESLRFGDKLARGIQKKPGTRMDGKPIPRYPPVVKVTLIRDDEAKEEKGSERDKE